MFQLIQLCILKFCSIFTDFVEKHKLEPDQFGLEVTETAELADINVASESLRILKGKGIKIALDDFGAGYASLKYVRGPTD
jgi:EAL domain-containing protein (putative c-di-GMP-specific phosphodiesterase class I)